MGKMTFKKLKNEFLLYLLAIQFYGRPFPYEPKLHGEMEEPLFHFLIVSAARAQTWLKNCMYWRFG